MVRRYLTGLSAAGLTAAVALTVAVGDASASPAASTSGRVVTLTSSSSAPTGKIAVQLKYTPGPKGKVLSVAFSGGSPLRLRHPALIISLRPLPTQIHVRPPRVQKVAKGSVAFLVILRLRSGHHFSVTAPAKLLASINKALSARPRRLGPLSYVLTATLGTVSGGKRPINISAPVGLQVGMLVGPAAP